MVRYSRWAIAALAGLLTLGFAAQSASAHGVRYYPAHGQLVSTVVLQHTTTVIIRHEVRAVRIAHYSYRGHRYAFGHGPLWHHHLAYCHHRFRSYNPHTNLFLAYSGHHHHCRSPYIR